MSGFTFLLLGACSGERPEFGTGDTSTAASATPDAAAGPDAAANSNGSGSSEDSTSVSSTTSNATSSTSGNTADDTCEGDECEEAGTDDDDDSDPDSDDDTTPDNVNEAGADDDDDSDPDSNDDSDPDSDDDADDTNTSEEAGTDTQCPDGCLINGTCYAEGELDDDNQCVVCDPEESNDSWTNVDEACDDGSECTENDHCDDGACVGEEKECDDGVECNGEETCNEDDGDCDRGESTCEGNTVCDVNNDQCSAQCDGCVIDGNCYADNAPNPTDPCFVCDVAENDADWTVAEAGDCDDDDLCTENDECNADGQCIGQAVTCTNDEGECGASRSCDPSNGECAEDFPGAETTCVDGDPCTGDDHCNGAGVCEGTPAIDDGAGCSCLENEDCNDSVACTTDTCNDGECSWVVNANSCLIGGQCYASGTADPNNDCRQCNPTTSNTSWSDSPNTTDCDDGLWCNGADTCNGTGSCGHQFANGNRCANTTGDCEVQACNENVDHCFAAAGTVCESEEVVGCLEAEEDVCAGDVRRWPIQYTCSGSSANCGTTANERFDLATLVDNCGADEACHSSGECRPKLGCESTYCNDGLCWTRENAPGEYQQNEGRVYCGNLGEDVLFVGRDDWRLPTVEQYQTLLIPETNDCFWSTAEMGSCNDELWSTDEAQSFAFWVGTSALMQNTAELNIRCVVEE